MAVSAIVLVLIILLIYVDWELETNQLNYIVSCWLFDKPTILDNMMIWNKSPIKIVLVSNCSMPIHIYCKLDLFNYVELKNNEITITLEALKTQLARISSKDICYCLGSEQLIIKDTSVLDALEKLINLQRTLNGLNCRKIELHELKNALRVF